MSEPQPATILNVDDDEAGRYAMTRALRQAEFRVLEATTGTEALRLAREGPDLVLLDVNLPDIDGLEVCRRLRADPRTRGIPVLHVSATRVKAEHQIQGLEGGADGYLVEPVEPGVLVATVKALLRARQAERSAAKARSEAEALRAVTLLAGAAAHEINNPLTVIQGNLQFALADLSGPARDRVERALAAAERVAAIVARMQQITRIEVTAPSPGVGEILDLRRSSAETDRGSPGG